MRVRFKKREMEEKQEHHQLAEQYNKCAASFASLASDGNADSNAVFYKCLPTSLAGKFVLDLGCGNGEDLAYYQSKGAIIFGIDASEEMVTLSRARNPYGAIQLGRLDAIPFENAIFDIVVSKWALQTTPHIDPVYEEIFRVLKPNGHMILLAGHPIRQFMEKKHKPKDYFEKEMLESTFFDGKVTVTEPSHTMNEYISPSFLRRFSLLAYDEKNAAGAEKVNGDNYPSYLILSAQRKG